MSATAGRLLRRRLSLSLASATGDKYKHSRTQLGTHSLPSGEGKGRLLRQRGCMEDARMRRASSRQPPCSLLSALVCSSLLLCVYSHGFSRRHVRPSFLLSPLHLPVHSSAAGSPSSSLSAPLFVLLFLCRWRLFSFCRSKRESLPAQIVRGRVKGTVRK